VRGGNQYLLIAMDNFTKWPKVYTIPNQKPSEVVDVRMTNFFSGTSRELYCEQGKNFKSQRYRRCWSTLERAREGPPLFIQSDNMVE
jgi:hypothetical protein